jgi:ribA/ribD-fused uncharacterized protein
MSQQILFFFTDKGPTGYLSNFFTETPFTDPATGTVYKTSEHYFMTQKALKFASEKNKNADLAKQIPLCASSKEAKQLGRQVKDFSESVWATVRFDTMVQGLRMKFAQNPVYRDRLLATNSAILVEASPYDKLWGIGMSATGAKKLTESELNAVLASRNLLGKALMVVREELRV